MSMSVLDPHMLIHLVVRWLDLAAMVVLIGGIVFDAVVMTPVLARMTWTPTERETVMRRYPQLQAKLMGWSLGLLTAIQFVDIVLRVQMMSQQPLAAVAGILIPAIRGTHVGKVWIGKMVILVALTALWIHLHKSRRTATPDPSWFRPVILSGSGLFCLAIALAGHAADRGSVSLAVVADGLHVMAVTAWAGGLVSLRVLIPAISDSLDETTSSRLFVRTLARFSTVAGWSLGILAVTGAYNVWLHIPSWVGLTSTYGFALLVKLAFVAPMIALGALGRYHILPELHALIGDRFHAGVLAKLTAWFVRVGRRLIQPSSPSSCGESISSVHARGLRFIALECVLVIGVLAGTAVLTQTMAPRATRFGETEATPRMGDMPGM